MYANPKNYRVVGTYLGVLWQLGTLKSMIYCFKIEVSRQCIYLGRRNGELKNFFLRFVGAECASD